MKTKTSNSIEQLKKLSQHHSLNHSSVSFNENNNIRTVKGEKEGMNLFQELKDAVNSGDDTIWRMWR